MNLSGFNMTADTTLQLFISHLMTFSMLFMDSLISYKQKKTEIWQKGGPSNPYIYKAITHFGLITFFTLLESML